MHIKWVANLIVRNLISSVASATLHALHKQLANYSQSRPLTCFRNEVHWHTATDICWCINTIYASIYAMATKLSRCNRDNMEHAKKWNIYYLALYKNNLLNPGLKEQKATGHGGRKTRQASGGNGEEGNAEGILRGVTHKGKMCRKEVGLGWRGRFREVLANKATWEGGPASESSISHPLKLFPKT